MKADQIKVVIFDLDGVIYRGHTPIPGAGDVTRWLAAQIPQASACGVQAEARSTGSLRRCSGQAGQACATRYQVYYFTNNSTKTRESYVELLADYGIATDSHHIVTSGSLTARYFVENGLLPATALVVGEGGLAEELKRAGVRVVRRRGRRPIDYVVVGMDRKFTYRKLHEAQQAILNGARFIATNRDATYPVEGNVIPGGGSIVAAVATAAEREPLLIGKPSPEAGRLIAHHAGVEPHEMLIVGDRLETDIEMGRRAGLLTCLVLTGISGIEEVDLLSPSSRPHWVIESIAQLPELLQGRIGPRGDAR
jgi:HAD superfamily hydrolase (TIGR01450 family)